MVRPFRRSLLIILVLSMSIVMGGYAASLGGLRIPGFGPDTTIISGHGPRIRVSLSEQYLTFPESYNEQLNVTVQSVMGFSGQVTLEASMNDVGTLGFRLEPQTVFVPWNSSANSVLTVIGLSSGQYGVTVTATSGQLRDTASLNIQVMPCYPGGDFELALDPDTVTVHPGESASSRTILNNLGRNCWLKVSHSVLNQTDTLTVQAGFSGGYTNLYPGVNGWSTTQIHASPTALPGTYHVLLDATSGNISHSVILRVIVTTFYEPGISVTVNPESITIDPGLNATLTVTVKALGEFSGTISLTATLQPLVQNPPTLYLNPPDLTLVPGQSELSTLRISSDQTTTSGTYNFTVTGSNGTISSSFQGILYMSSQALAYQTLLREGSLSPSWFGLSHAVVSVLPAGPNFKLSVILLAAPVVAGQALSIYFPKHLGSRGLALP